MYSWLVGAPSASGSGVHRLVLLESGHLVGVASSYGQYRREPIEYISHNEIPLNDLYECLTYLGTVHTVYIITWQRGS